MYKLYGAHRRRVDALEGELALQRENEELIKAQLSAIPSLISFTTPEEKEKGILMTCFFNVDIDRMQAHFENIQRISDTITLPHAMHNLSCRVAEDLDLSQLLERLIQGKGQPNTLTSTEKLELWERLKILSMNLLLVWTFIMPVALWLC